MNYALIENKIVTNIIWLYEDNEKDFPEAVKINDKQIAIGDNYEDGKFYRNGEEVLSDKEIMEITLNILLNGGY